MKVKITIGSLMLIMVLVVLASRYGPQATVLIATTSRPVGRTMASAAFTLPTGYRGSDSRWNADLVNHANLPNIVDAPNPIGRNFYELRVNYPHYLLCGYPVESASHTPDNDRAWLAEALAQIRRSTSKSFPPFQKVAVIIVNYANYRGEVDYTSAHIVGALFQSSDVFNRSLSLESLVNSVELDRSPFLYDKGQPTPADQDRWLIIERDIERASTNPTTR